MFRRALIRFHEAPQQKIQGEEKMKKILLGTVGLLVLGLSSASAADMAPRPYAKAPPMIVDPIYNWTGFYIGGNGGYGSSRKCWDFAGTATTTLAVLNPEGCHNATGGLVGGQVGYNWQAGSWVFGVEAQGDWANLTGSNVSLAFPTFTNRSRIDGIGLFTGRVGFAWNAALLYVKGGAAVADDKYNYFLNGSSVNTGIASETRWGGVAGVGFEYGFTPNWSAALEYDHMFMGSVYDTFASPASTRDRISQDVDMVTVRINYRFGGPVVARY
jgi:outer membrane immunogenic protein